MKVDLLVFSGKPDPTWELTREEIKGLHELLLSMPGTMESWDSLPDQGYRGIQVVMDPIETLRVYKGYAEVVGDREIRRFMDINRELEVWLFATAENRIPDDVYNQLLTREFTRH